MISMQKGCLLFFIITIGGVLYRCWDSNSYYYIKIYISRISQVKTDSSANVSDPATPAMKPGIKFVESTANDHIQSNISRLSQVKDNDGANLYGLSFLTTKPGIMFVESTDNVEPSPLTVCSVEAAARLNPDKQIYYFMKGFSGNLSQYPQPEYRGIPLLSSMRNVVILPLNPTELFEDTLLEGWYQKVNPEKERFWAHVLADGCRLALLWKYGGIYLDTDILSLMPIPFANFACSEGGGTFNNAALGSHDSHNPFYLECLEDFVANYAGGIWGQQGPQLITRVLKRWCKTDNPAALTGKECNGISLWITKRFYPIPYRSWRSYYVPWKKEDIEHIFSTTYGAHIWSFMNQGKENVIAGSGSLIEHLFQECCPTSYKNLVQSNNQ